MIIPNINGKIQKMATKPPTSHVFEMHGAFVPKMGWVFCPPQSHLRTGGMAQSITEHVQQMGSVELLHGLHSLAVGIMPRCQWVFKLYHVISQSGSFYNGVFHLWVASCPKYLLGAMCAGWFTCIIHGPLKRRRLQLLSCDVGDEASLWGEKILKLHA